MPVYLRNFYFNQLVDEKKEEKKQVEQSNRKSRIQRPNIRR